MSSGSGSTAISSGGSVGSYSESARSGGNGAGSISTSITRLGSGSSSPSRSIRTSSSGKITGGGTLGREGVSGGCTATAGG